jgi:hypothetical protein
MLDALQQWQGLLALTISLSTSGLIAWVAWSVRRQFVTRAEFEAFARQAAQRTDVEALADRFARQVTEHAVRLHDVAIWQARAEERLQGIPTPAQMTELAVSLSVTAERMAGLAGIVDRVERTVERQEAFMLKHM